MRLKKILLFSILLTIIIPAFGTNVAGVKDGYNEFLVYNNSDSSIYISAPGISGLDLINQSKKFDCKGSYSTSCAEVQPNGNISIAPGKSYIFKVISNVKSLKGQAFINGAITLPIVTTQYAETENQVVLPVQVNPYGAVISNYTIDTNKEGFVMGASTLSNNLDHPKYVMSVTFYNSPYGQATTVVVSHAPNIKATGTIKQSA